MAPWIPTANPAPPCLRLAGINAHFQSGLANALDEAVLAAAAKAGVDFGDVHKVDEIPYDFMRKCLSVVAADATGARTLITKGALDNVLALCTSARSRRPQRSMPRCASASKRTTANGARRDTASWAWPGARWKRAPASYTRVDERGLCFAGFLLFLDPPKADARQTVIDLARRGVQLKIITGDNQKVARHVAEAVNLPVGARDDRPRTQ